MKNCQHKGDQCWEKANLILWLEKCVSCNFKQENAESFQKGSPVSLENISMDSHGRMFLDGDEI